MYDREKANAEALMKLVEFRMTRVAGRREHEWKVTVALWALLAAGLIQLRIPHTCLAVGLLVPGLIAVVIGHAFLWIGNHWARSKEDILASFFYADRAHNLALPGEQIQALRHQDGPEPWPNMPRCETWFGFLGEPRCWGQILTTAALASGVLAIQFVPSGAP
jgi:hypothetical protein